jgi:selenocysteine lyase/cysteine desulfurase
MSKYKSNRLLDNDTLSNLFIGYTPPTTYKHIFSINLPDVSQTDWDKAARSRVEIILPTACTCKIKTTEYFLQGGIYWLMGIISPLYDCKQKS